MKSVFVNLRFANVAGLLLVSLLFGNLASAVAEDDFSIPSASVLKREQPESHFDPFPERLPPPEAEASPWQRLPWPRSGDIGQTVAKIPDYLPEGLVPPITGPTGAYDIGQPLTGTSWLNSSHSAGMFLGTIGGATLIDNQLEQAIGGIFGLRFGIDYDHRWGLEKRFGFAQMNAYDLFQHQHQIVNMELGDVDLLFYPWGDTRWRPYMSMGGGLAHFQYQSDSGRKLDRLLLGLPWGIGLKYFWSEGVAFRIELVDNLMLGTHELSTMNNISLAFGTEFRYTGFHLGRQSNQ
jgi:hypothetical protein